MFKLSGKTFGRLLVVERAGSKNGCALWRCKCSCGKEAIVRGPSLLHGNTLSCGCLGREIHSARMKRPREVTCYCCGKKFTAHNLGRSLCSRECRKEMNKRTDRQRRSSDVSAFVLGLISSRKSQCEKKGIPYEIDVEFVVELLKKQNNRCAKTGIALDLCVYTKHGARWPWSVSIDRIVPEKGYTKDNVQIVCFAYNLAKHIWTDDVVLEMAKALIARQKMKSKKKQENDCIDIEM